MNNDYQQKVKSLAMLREKQPKMSLAELYAQMILDECLINRRIDQLRKLIDQSLDQGDKELFIKLSKEYKNLCR
ncbi:IDEAL domain-containing protein [Scopulibacillus cellulosilyticus]|uniref:IDEAL domain-containing protein n=1 Tax=Scopulibacillus cellulosilyticus TaxID=2665665 RepID=A0ABW2PVV7_9BACL